MDFTSPYFIDWPNRFIKALGLYCITCATVKKPRMNSPFQLACDTTARH